MNKQLIISLILITGFISGASATFELVNETFYIYNGTDVTYMDSNNRPSNIEKIVVDGGICSEMHMGIGLPGSYDFTYEMHYAPNESTYFTTLVRITQEVTDSRVFGMYKDLTRTCYINGNQVATYNTTSVLRIGNRNTFKFVSIDRTVTFGDKIVHNATLFFTEMTTQDQYDYIQNVTGDVYYKFHTLDISGTGDAYTPLAIGGLGGIFLSGIQNRIPSLYNVIYPVMVLIQFILNFSFTFINLIVNDWWYSLLLLEIFCMFMATKESGYVNIVSVYINTHVQIIVFVHHKIMLPLIDMVISILNTIKNMIKWW